MDGASQLVSEVSWQPGWGRLAWGGLQACGGHRRAGCGGASVQMAGLCPMQSYPQKVRWASRGGLGALKCSRSGGWLPDPGPALKSLPYACCCPADQAQSRCGPGLPRGVGPGKWEPTGVLPSHCPDTELVLTVAQCPSALSQPSAPSTHCWSGGHLSRLPRPQSFQSQIYRPWLPCSMSRSFGAPFNLLFFEALNRQSRKPLTLPQ